MNYAEWNDAIASRFFNASNEGKRTFLAVDREVLAQIGGQSDAATEFVAAVRTAPDGIAKRGDLICRLARRSRQKWRGSGGAGFPPYIGYLALLVFAASTEGEYQNEGFQKRLHRLLGEEISNAPPRGFYDLWELWTDLELWVNEDHQGALGTFSCPLAGAKAFVDQPCSQIVLTEGERKRLPEIFASGDLDPAAPPAGEAVAGIAVRFGAGRLQPKTLRRLSRAGAVDEEFRSATIEAILDELREWNGYAESSQDRAEHHVLRINLKIVDKLAGIAQARLIAKDAESFEQDEFVLHDESGAAEFRLGLLEGGWSNSLEDSNGAAVDAGALAWESGLRLTAPPFAFCLPARKVRVFKHGEHEGVSGLLEANRLDPHREFYVAAHQSSRNAVEQWGKSAADGWCQINLRTGYPKGWSLYYGKSAKAGGPSPAEFPALRVDSRARIFLTGGVKTRPLGRRYFDFAPPSVRLEGLLPSMQLFVNGEERQCEAGDVVLQFEPLKLSGQVVVKVAENGEARGSASFQVVSPADLAWKDSSVAAASDALGKAVTSPAAPCVCGGISIGFAAPGCLIGLDRAAYLIGAKAGQVASVPSQPLPKDWEPVWIVEQRRGKRRAIFCGGDPALCAPAIDGACDARMIREWKRILWHDRRTISGPTRGQAAALWIRFRKVAERV